MKTLLFARKEEESKGAIPKDRRAHVDDDGKRGGARLVADPLASRRPVWQRKRQRALPSACCAVHAVSALRFDVVYEDAGEGWVYAHVPELPEVQTQGEDLEQARVMVLDAISMVLEERRARGELIPEPGWALVESVEVAA
jgi:predicted RNase H-like HicB family nuclease